MTKGSIPAFLRDNYLLILIFILGALLRFYGLDREGIWYDEAVSVAVSKLSFKDIIRWVFDNKAETNPPFYYMVLSVWVPVFGDSEAVLRVPSVIFGSLSVIAIYAVGRQLFDKKTALIAALILALSAFHLRYAQEARGYTLMVCLILVSYYSFLRLTIGKSKLYAAVYVVSTALLVYTHYYGTMIILAQNIFCFTLLLRKRKIGEIGLGGWIKLQAMTGLVLLPGLVFLAVIALKIQKGFWVPEPSSEAIWQFLIIYAGSVYLLVLFLAFSVYAAAGLRKGNPAQVKKPGKTSAEPARAAGLSEGEKLYMLLVWMAVPVLVPYLISLVSSPILIFRYTIGASLALYLLASNGIGKMQNRWLITAAAGLILIFSFANVNTYFSTVRKHQWRELMTFVESNAGPADIIVVSPVYEMVTAEYYHNRKDLTIVPLGNKFPVFENLGRKNIWFVFHEHPESRANSRAGLGAEYDITEFQYNRLDLFKLSKKKND
ncbi:MAG: glycosyltransferase family 39 protein [Thermodesulfobacteriota bacterium]